MKEQLAQLIETYAAARVSGNTVLQKYATQMLSNFLQQVEITPLTLTSPEAATTDS